MNHKRIPSAPGVVFIIIWSGFVVAAYFVVQKPLALQVIDHLLGLVWTFIVTSILFLNACALGSFTLKRLIPDSHGDDPFLLLACGIGLGELGLLGFGLAALGASSFPILTAVQILLLAWTIWRGLAGEVILQIKHWAKQFKDSSLQVPVWMKAAGFTALALTFLMTLLPPVEAFDALLYHLTVPDLWLRDAGLRAYDFPHYWFPGLVEGAFLWGLGLGSEIVPQQLHFFWAVSTALLLWHWTRRLWDDRTAWWTLTFIISMPSLLLLASWAYTDLALTFFGVSMLYTLWRGRESNDPRWWRISAIAAGMAMGVKYTSFVMPLTAVALIAAWKFRDKKGTLLEPLRFSIISTVTGGVWYLRNWVWMDNPFYPFVFGGRYWDSFRAAWFAGAGTGSGWDIKALLSLPLTITLGYQDINFFDGDIGPLLLLSLPVFLLAMTGFGKLEPKQRTALGILLLFTAASAALWVYGYATTRNLWQTRLLLPALAPFTLPAAFGMANIHSLDTKRIRISFVVSSIAAFAIFTNLLDMGLSVIARAPLAVVTGVISREEFAGRFQPAFTSALETLDRTPQDAKIYFLFEPRSYGASREVQPDPILDNFSHDVFLHGTPEAIIGNWRARGYTHILINTRGAMLVLADKDEKAIFDKTAGLLIPTSISQDGSYELFEIPLP